MLGEKGEDGETPVITVAEDTPVSYRLRFETGKQEVTTPNLYGQPIEYHVDISAVNSTLAVPIRDLVLTYQTTSSTACASAPHQRIPLCRSWPIFAGHPFITEGPSRP